MLYIPANALPFTGDSYGKKEGEGLRNGKWTLLSNDTYAKKPIPSYEALRTGANDPRFFYPSKFPSPSIKLAITSHS